MFLKKVKEIKEYILEPVTILSVILGVISGIVTNFLTVRDNPWALAFIITLIVLLIIIWSFAAYRFHFRNKIIQDVKKDRELQIIKFYENKKCHLLLSKNDYLRNGDFITLYLLKEQLEEYLVTGKVINIQDNGIVQIHFERINKGKLDEIRKLLKNDAEIIKNVRIRTTLTEEYLEESLFED